MNYFLTCRGGLSSHLQTMVPKYCPQVPTNLLCRSVDPFVFRLLSGFVVLPDRVRGGSGYALACFRSPALMRRYSELMQEASFAPWVSCKLACEMSATFADQEALDTCFVDATFPTGMEGVSPAAVEEGSEPGKVCVGALVRTGGFLMMSSSIRRDSEDIPAV